MKKTLSIIGTCLALVTTTYANCRYYNDLSAFLGDLIPDEITAEKMCSHNKGRQFEDSGVSYHLITSYDDSHCSYGSCFIPEARMLLAKKIIHELDPNRINIYQITSNDMLGAITQGLISEAFHGMRLWEVDIKVDYLGEGEEIKEQIESNPKKMLRGANTIFPGQYVGIKDDLTVLVSEDLDLLVAWLND